MMWLIYKVGNLQLLDNCAYHNNPKFSDRCALANSADCIFLLPKRFKSFQSNRKLFCQPSVFSHQIF